MTDKVFASLNSKILLLIALLISCYTYTDGIVEIVRRWNEEDEYGHGPLLLLLAVFFVYQKLPDISHCQPNKNSIGLIIIIVSSLIFIAGEISSLFILIHYAFVATVYGLFVSLYGINVTRHIAPSLILLVFSIPLPYFLQTELTIKLQLLSSWLGVTIIKLLSIPAYLEGNMIDLGKMQLQVVEACADLRYMFSLMSFGYICAYVYRVEMWKRVVIFLSTIPITIIMNSTRIAVVGILVHTSGIQMAEGFTHKFQGITIFSICLLILFAEMWLLTKLGRQRVEFRKVFGLDFSSQTAVVHQRSTRASLLTGLAITAIVVTAVSVHQLGQREEIIPDRTPLIRFPMQVEQWSGISQAMDDYVINELKLSDYVSADYRLPDSNVPVNFYIAYYESQRKGASPHSPRVCIPGGGWEISDISRRTMLLDDSNEQLLFNRAVIQKDNRKQLVYYWFQQRGRTISNEYFMKWYLFSDAVLRNRSDGALVRLVTPVLPNEKMDVPEQRLQRFANDIAPYMSTFIPE